MEMEIKMRGRAAAGVGGGGGDYRDLFAPSYPEYTRLPDSLLHQQRRPPGFYQSTGQSVLYQHSSRSPYPPPPQEYHQPFQSFGIKQENFEEELSRHSGASPSFVFPSPSPSPSHSASPYLLPGLESCYSLQPSRRNTTGQHQPQREPQSEPSSDQARNESVIKVCKNVEIVRSRGEKLCLDGQSIHNQKQTSGRADHRRG